LVNLLYEEFLQLPEEGNWHTSRLLANLRQSKSTTRRGQVRWMTVTELEQKYGGKYNNGGIVDDIIARKRKTGDVMDRSKLTCAAFLTFCRVVCFSTWFSLFV
jgi:hypothetical protein